jgi:hypothetical protein
VDGQEPARYHCSGGSADASEDGVVLVERGDVAGRWMLGADDPGAEVRVQGPSVFVPVLDQGDLPDGGGCGAVPDAGEPTGDGLVAVACAADDDGLSVEAP